MKTAHQTTTKDPVTNQINQLLANIEALKRATLMHRVALLITAQEIKKEAN